MPCNCDYMDPTDFENELGMIYLILDELSGKKVSKAKYKDPGMDGRAYGKILLNEAGKELLNTKLQELCPRLKALEKSGDLTKYSLELQMWWRDHKAADALEKRQEKEEAGRKTTRAKALSKLTKKEKAALGVVED